MKSIDSKSLELVDYNLIDTSTEKMAIVETATLTIKEATNKNIGYATNGSPLRYQRI